MAMNPARMRELLQAFAFRQLFIEELGWSQPPGNAPAPFSCGDRSFTRRPIAQLGGVVVFAITADDGRIPDLTICAAVHREIAKQYHENLLIFLDGAETQARWYWAKREGGKWLARPHLYVRGQPGDLFLSKISALFVDISAFGVEGDISVVEMAERLRRALDVQPTTKKFYEEYQREHLRFIEHIAGVGDERDRRWYASVLLNRLMFIYFLQRKGWLDGGNREYLQEKLAASAAGGPDRFYSAFLRPLFFDAFAIPESDRPDAVRAAVGAIPYLSGSIFLLHPVEERWPAIAVDDAAFANLFHLFTRFSWNLDDTPGASDDEINPDVLGYIFEKYINQKAFGAYYTRPEITDYLCEQTIHRVILNKINPEPGGEGDSGMGSPAMPSVGAIRESPSAEGRIEHGGQSSAARGRFEHRPYGERGRRFDTMDDLLTHLDAARCRALLGDILPNLRILDPACGSGAFLVAAMKTLIPIYSAVVGQIHFLHDAWLNDWLRQARQHQSVNYHIKKRIISDNLFGVDIMEEAAEIAQLRLYLALVSSVEHERQLEPLPNIDFNILTGNSQIGLLHVDEAKYPATLFYSYKDVVREKNNLIAKYRAFARPDEDLRALRNDIQAHRDEAAVNLNDLLLDDWKRLGIKYEQATWDAAKNKERKPAKRALTAGDIARLRPFHWGYEFDQALNERGGFDVIITNPPWEIFKPQAKEFFAHYSALVTKNTMTIKEFEEHQSEALRDPELRAAWLEYLSAFPYQSLFYRSAKQYANQISVVNGKKAGTDINLYKLFTEQCYNLLRPGGQCGIVIPSGIYTDLGTKQLREMLFSETQISGLFCFENSRAIFEGVHRSFKFIVLTYGKGGSTTTFPAAFMRHAVAELDRFPQEGALDLSVALIRRLSPDSLSVMEFKNATDVQIAEKMLQFPLLGEKIEGTWNLVLTNEFHMTNDSHLFQTAPGPGRLPLYEGKMMHQFSHQLSQPRYWVNENEGRKALMGRSGADNGQTLDYQDYRLAFRRIGRNTDERTMIATILPKNNFASESFNYVVRGSLTYGEACALTAVLNSLTLDSCSRQRVSANINMFYAYQLPIPRLTERDAAFKPIVERAARLICTTPEFDDLARAVGLRGHEEGATDPAERARLRAELDGIVAHLYGLTDDEFAHILRTFPLVAQPIKEAALAAYRARTPQPGDTEIAALIAQRESGALEFKEAVRWDMKEKTGEKVFLKEIAAFMNAKGGTLLIGVADDGTITGLDADYQTLSEKMGRNRDGYERFLTSLLASRLGADNVALSAITFHAMGDREICRVVVQPAAEEVWLKEGADEIFYVRIGNKSEPLRGPALTRYTRTRWP